MTDEIPRFQSDVDVSPLSSIDIIWAIKCRLGKLYSLTKINSEMEVGDKSDFIQGHLLMESNSLVDELQILVEQLADNLTS